MSEDSLDLREDLILQGPLFNESMRIVTIRQNGPDSWELGLVGLQTERYRPVTLTSAQLQTVSITDSIPSYAGDGHLFKLGLQAYALGIAHEFDPYFGLSVSRVDPLPHQLEAIYDHLLKLPRVQFLLADDAGAGKTIMAGLLIRELKLRGLIERILIVCPANLSFQWERELKDKFDEKFKRLRGADLDSYSMNQWIENNQVITSLDLAKLERVLPGLRQCHWDLVIIDEAHRMSARDESHKSMRYKLGELLRDTSDHILLLTATPHKGDPANFSLFLQLLDRDVYADVRSIREAMERRRAPFYLRRTKEAMVYFPERQADGTWQARKIFTKRITITAGFSIDGAEFDLYAEVTRFVKRQSAKAAARGDDPRARAVGFLMSLYQRRLASSTHSLRRSLENRANRLETRLKEAQTLARTAPPDIPDPEEFEEMEDAERERFEAVIEAITISENAKEVQEEVAELRGLAEKAKKAEREGVEAKLQKLQEVLKDEGFFDDPSKRLLIFTEFRDTLNHLLERLDNWGLKAGCIHGGMKIGLRDQSGTRLHSEQQFREGEIQVLVATEAAGEGINLQCCNILFNYDIPWNPNRLEQRMGRIHRYGQKKDCLIFNFVATNTIEGRVLQRLLEKLQEIRDALDDDAVFNVVGEILPAAHIERVFRNYYAGQLGDADFEDRIMRNVDEGQFRAICQNALEGLAMKKLNLEMLVERRARAQERRFVPEAIARFMQGAAKVAEMNLKTVKNLDYTFDTTTTPIRLRQYERKDDWRLPSLANRYGRISTDRDTAEGNSLEWVTPGHPLFEALRRNAFAESRDSLSGGACLYSIEHSAPSRMDFYRARVVDGNGIVVHERLFALEISVNSDPKLIEPSTVGNFSPAPTPETLPPICAVPEARDWLNENVLDGFLTEVENERLGEVERITSHVETSLTELLQKEDALIGRFSEEAERGAEGAAGNLKKAEDRHAELLARRQRRMEELQRQKSLTLQNVERLATALILPHPERDKPEVKNLHPDPETEAIAMRVAMEYEEKAGRTVADVHEKNLGYDLTSLDSQSGELRLIEVKGIGAETGTICLTPNEKRVAEDRRDCYWLYVVTSAKTEPHLELIQDPARLDWHEVKKIDHYYVSVDAAKKPIKISEEEEQYGDG